MRRLYYSNSFRGSLEYYCQLKFILLTYFTTTDKSCDFQADIIQFDHLQQGEHILTAWNITVRYCSPSV